LAFYSFSNSPFQHLWAPLMRSSLPLAIMETIWSEWTRAWWLPLSYLSFECLLVVSHEVQSRRLMIPRTIWSEWTQSGQSPLVSCEIPLECLFRKGHVYYLSCIYCTICIPTQLSSLSLFCQNIQFKCFFQLTFKFNDIVWSLLFYYSILV
jgi:hypothetical protein